MAEAIASAVVQQVVEQLTSAARQEIGLYCGFKDDLNKLDSRLRTIQLVLRDAEVKQRKNEALQDWLRKLKDAAYDAEGILDLIATESLRRGLDSQRGTFHKFKSCLSLQNPLAFRLMMAHKVKKRMEKLDAIANERRQFVLSEEAVVRYGVASESRKTGPLVKESEICGREEEKEMIVEKLLGGGGPGEDGLSVFAIWGMGGLGKTTLAQLVYNDEKVVRHFELHIWVCVSDDFSTDRLVRVTIETIEGVGCSVSELDPLQRKLQEKLRGRRFLLVLDDVWNDNPILWDPLKEILTCGSEGSMLLVTTRIEKVASIMAPITRRHKIGCLSNDDSWTLFRRRAFANGDEEENLVSIGKTIVRKCGGVPLAIKALGSLMLSKSDEDEWLAVRDGETWDLTDEGNGILPVLRLSYDNLTPQMRQCFTYCCIFPKDYEMEKDELIQLWMANGFIFSKGQMDMHVAGDSIFKELVWRSFLQDVQTYNSGRTTCKMHDLMHDLASSVMGNETYVVEGANVQEIPKMLRHLSIEPKLVIGKKSELKRSVDGHLRSLILQNAFGENLRKVCANFLIEQQHLRALKMDDCNLGKFTSTVCKLKQLRYLAISCWHMKRLPESLTHLVNLQTLRLRDTGGLLELPKGMKTMKDLYVVELTSYDLLRCTPPGLGDLTRLCGLSIFIVGQDAPHRISQLKELNLGGRLSIKRLENVRDVEDAKSANLMGKENLTSLRLYWTDGAKVDSAEHFEEVLEGLLPPRNLAKMYIESYQGLRFPSWMSTANLSEIRMENCDRCEDLLPLAMLPSLRCLELQRMDSMKHFLTEWHGGNAAFPALTHLYIRDMPNFEGGKTIDSIVCFPCIEDLYIRRCPKLTKLQIMPTLTNLEIYDQENAALVGSITFLTALRSLRLYDIRELDVLPAGLLQNHKALEHLLIYGLPIGTLSDLLDNLSALKTLSLYCFPNLELFPERLQHLNSLESLLIWYCGSIRSLPDSFRSLQSLRQLSIFDCPHLVKRCKKPDGEDWPKISHISFILINGTVLQDNGGA